MARHKNDGLGKIAGRQKGTPNKKINIAEWAEKLVTKRRAQFEKDLEALSPQERAAIFGGLISAIITGKFAGVEDNV